MNRLIVFALCLMATTSFAQKRVFPAVNNYGGIFEIPYAAEKPDPNLDYKIVIEVERESENPDSLSWAINNVARLVNLHVMGGVPKEKLDVVMVIHGGATYNVMDNAAYQKKFKTNNPNLNLFKELSKAGVRIFVCGQSLINRKVDRNKMVPEVKIATSMLTTLTTYQLKGYALLKF
ncbi:MAG: DsrE family protein [Cyclobacteriaceae bacterium]|jgi:intracellular sulfur oxidation DsrE/DsrF family protein